MSERGPVRGIVLGHGALPEGMVDAVRQITGIDEEALLALSNSGLSPDVLASRVEELIGGARAIVFVDLQSGSCGFTARRICRGREDSAVLFGVNLPQLLDFVMHRDMEIGPLVERLLEKGHSGLCCASDHRESRADHSLSSG